MGKEEEKKKSDKKLRKISIEPDDLPTVNNSHHE